jgi:hypothetical protein
VRCAAARNLLSQMVTYSLPWIKFHKLITCHFVESCSLKLTWFSVRCAASRNLLSGMTTYSLPCNKFQKLITYHFVESCSLRWEALGWFLFYAGNVAVAFGSARWWPLNMGQVASTWILLSFCHLFLYCLLNSFFLSWFGVHLVFERLVFKICIL